jgi:hypothetical protein
LPRGRASAGAGGIEDCVVTFLLVFGVDRALADDHDQGSGIAK